MLHTPEVVGTLTTEEMLQLCKKAGYGEDASQKAASERALARLRKDLPP